MNQNKNYRVLFSNLYKDTQMQENAKMSEHINFRVGGPVDILLTPNTKEQIVETINICKENKIPFYVLGNGSNVLVKDSGIRGVVIKLSEFDNIVRDGNTIKAESGALLKDVSAEALKASLTGFEFACGIPGSVGGAVFMNAGAYDGEISFVIKESEVMSEDGKIITLSKDQLELGYRTSAIMKKII